MSISEYHNLCVMMLDKAIKHHIILSVPYFSLTGYKAPLTDQIKQYISGEQKL